MEPINQGSKRKRSASIGETTKPAVDKKSNGVLPLSRVKKIVKLASNNAIVSAGSAKLIQLCAEEYLRAFVTNVSEYTEKAGRKTVQTKDLDQAIKNDYAFAWLEDALTEWPGDEPNKQPTIEQAFKTK